MNMSANCSLPCVLLALLLLNISSVAARNWQYGGGGTVYWDSNCDFPGSDIIGYYDSQANCGGDCLNNPQCTHFSASNGVCWLKKINAMYESVLLESVCGFLPGRSNQSWSYWQPGNGGAVYWDHNCDFNGADIISYYDSQANCGGDCVSNPQCTHFGAINGVCYLKTASCMNETPSPGEVCGFVVGRSQQTTSGCSTTTTTPPTTTLATNLTTTPATTTRVTTTTPTTTPPANNFLSQSLQRHNYYRSRHSAPNLALSSTVCYNKNG